MLAPLLKRVAHDAQWYNNILFDENGGKRIYLEDVPLCRHLTLIITLACDISFGSLIQKTMANREATALSSSVVGLVNKSILLEGVNPNKRTSREQTKQKKSKLSPARIPQCHNNRPSATCMCNCSFLFNPASNSLVFFSSRRGESFALVPFGIL